MRLPDSARSQVILIGAAEYGTESDLPDLPAVGNNLDDLHAALADPIYGWLAPHACTTVLNPTSPDRLGITIAEQTARAEDLVLIYYAGHGLLSPRGELYLATTRTNRDQLRFTAFPFDGIREILNDSPAANRVVILDCCYSGRAIAAMSHPRSAAYDQLDITGTYILTSTTATTIAHAPVGARHTAFTGELIKLLRDGDPDIPELVTLDHIYRSTCRSLIRQGLPRPQQRGTDATPHLAIIRNHAHDHKPPKTDSPDPQDDTASAAIAARPQTAAATTPVLVRTEKPAAGADGSYSPTRPLNPEKPRPASHSEITPESPHPKVIRMGVERVTRTRPLHSAHSARPPWNLPRRARAPKRLRLAAIAVAVAAIPVAFFLAHRMLNAGPSGTLADPGGKDVKTVAFAPSGTTLAVGDSHSTYLWNTATGRLTATLTDPANLSDDPNGQAVNALAFAGGTTLAVGDDDGITYLWNAKTEKLAGTLADPGGGGVTAVAFAPGGTTLAVADYDGDVYLWNTTTKKLTTTLPAFGRGDQAYVTSVAFAPGGTTLAIAELDGKVYLWNTTTKKLTATLTEPSYGNDGPDAMAFGTGGTTLAANNGIETTYVWDIASGTLTATLIDPQEGSPSSVAFEPGSTTLAVGDLDGNIYLWNTSTGKLSATLPVPGGNEGNSVTSVAFAPGGTTLAAGSMEGSTYLQRII